MNWEPNTEKKFKALVSKIPVFHRRITESVVTKAAEENAGKEEKHHVRHLEPPGDDTAQGPRSQYDPALKADSTCSWSSGGIPSTRMPPPP